WHGHRDPPFRWWRARGPGSKRACLTIGNRDSRPPAPEPGDERARGRTRPWHGLPVDEPRRARAPRTIFAPLSGVLERSATSPGRFLSRNSPRIAEVCEPMRPPRLRLVSALYLAIVLAVVDGSTRAVRAAQN